MYKPKKGGNMKVRKQIKEIWRDLHAYAKKVLDYEKSLGLTDPIQEISYAFGVYHEIEKPLYAFREFFQETPLDHRDTIWCKQVFVKELDAYAKTLRRSVLRVLDKHKSHFDFSPCFDDNMKPEQYHTLAMDLLKRIKEQRLVDKEKAIEDYGEGEREAFDLLLGCLNEVEERVDDFALSVWLSSVAEVRVGRPITTKPTGPDIDDLAYGQFLKQLPSLSVVANAYNAIEGAIGQYIFSVKYFQGPFTCALEHFALCEYIRTLAYKISKNLKIEYYAVG